MERSGSTPNEWTGRDSPSHDTIARWVSILVGLAIGLVWCFRTGVPAGSESIGAVTPLAIVGPMVLGATADWSDVGDLIDRIDRVAAGDYDVSFEVDRDDEVGQVAEALESMTDRLAAREAESDAQGAVTAGPIDAIDDVFYVVNRDGRLRQWNQSFEDVTGYDHEEFAKHHFLQFFETADRDAAAATLDRVFEEGHARIDAPLQTSDGEAIPYEWVATRFEAPDGTVVAAGIGRDISDREAHDRERDRYERRFEAIFDDPNLLAAVLDPDGTLLDVNDNAMERIDGDRSAVIGGPFWEGPWWAGDPAAQAEIREGIDRAAAGEFVEYEIHHEGPETETYASLGTIRPVFDDGDIVSLVVSAHDVTERHEQTNELRDRQERLSRYKAYTDDILDSIDDMIYVVDTERRFLRWNRGLCDATGYSDDEIVDMDPFDIVVDSDLDVVEEAFEETFDTGSARAEASIETKDGERIHYEFIASKLDDPDGNPVLVGVGRDITARKAYERDLQRYERRFQAVFDDPNLIAAVLDPDGTLRDVNDNAMERIDADRSAVIGDLFWETPWWAGYPDMQAEIREAIDRANDGEYVDYEIHHEGPHIETYTSSGTIRPVYDDGEVVSLVVSARDITERRKREAELVDRERELQRTQHHFRQAEQAASVGAWEIDVREEPFTFEATDEFYHIHGVSPDDPITPDEIIQLYDPDHQEYMERLLTAAIEEGTSYDMEVRIDAIPDGGRWIRSIAEPAIEDGDVVAVRGTIRDITDRKENELRFQTLHEVVRGFIEAESRQVIAEEVRDAAVTVLESPWIAVYLFEAETGRLEPAAISEQFQDATPDPTAGYDPRDSELLWEAYASGEVVVADDTALAESRILTSAPNSAVLVPIGDHGVFLLACEDAAVKPDDRRLAETLAATMETALSRLESDAALQDKQRQLETQNERLRRQVQITETIRRIDRSLVGSRTREEIESAVCEQLVESDDVAFAWIGGLDEDSLVPRVWAGDGHAYLDTVSLSADAPTPDPSVRAATTGEPVVVRSVVDNVTNEAWRKHALSEEFASLVAVPLDIDDHSYGVLTVYATEADVFGDLERRIFEELGENIANAIRALEAFRALYTDEFVELQLRLDSEETFLGRVAAATGATVEYVTLASRTEDESPLFFEVADADSAAVIAVLEGLHAVREYRQIGEVGGRTLFEATVAGTICAAHLVEHGGVPRSIRAAGDEIEVVVDVPVGTDVREFVETLRERHPSVELLARKNVTRDVQTRQELVSDLFEGLTERQLEVLRTAFFAGFFEWPRESTGQEVADLIGVSQPTVNRHLRHGLRGLLEQLFEEEPTTVAPT